jgi:hypothetical protein
LGEEDLWMGAQTSQASQNTNTVLGVHSFVTNGNCTGVT